ncbi:fimbrial protein [Pseudescherichia vulneris]
MNKSILVALLGLGIAGSLNAYAVDGTISITGQVVDASCSVAVSGGANDATVVLPTVSKTALSNPGDVAGATQVAMSLTGCPSTGSVRAFFEATNVDPATGFLKNNAATTPAEGVQVQVINASTATAIDLRDNSNNDYVPFVDNGTDGTADLNYSVQYVATAPATSGLVDTSLMYTLDYQ